MEGPTFDLISTDDNQVEDSMFAVFRLFTLKLEDSKIVIFAERGSNMGREVHSLAV